MDIFLSCVSEIQIGDALHEFACIDGIKEDLPQIIDNVKKIRIRSDEYYESPLYTSCTFRGPGNLTPAYFNLEAGYEFVNKDTVIARVTKDIDLDITLKITCGRGVSIAEHGMSEGVDHIRVDAIYETVKNVILSSNDIPGYPNGEELGFSVTTDETIIPEEAVTIAAKILTSYFELFMNIGNPQEDSDVVSDSEEESVIIPSDVSIDELELSVRASNCLRRGGIYTINQLLEKKRADLIKLRNLGSKSFLEIEEKLKQRVLCISDD